MSLVLKIDDLDLENFFEPLFEDSFREEACQITGISLAEFNEYLDGYINEARYAVARIEKYLVEGCRVLEVGAGLGLVSLFLASRGFSVVANNADQGVFSPMASLRQRVIARYPHVNMSVFAECIESVAAKDGEKFDFIFSLNVLEHTPNVEMALVAMSAMLKPSGCMWHSCPNYSFPYEPHLAVFLFPFFPEKTAYFFPGLVNRKFGVWNSLNFITARRLKRLMRKVGLNFMFSDEVFYRHLLRLMHDVQFRRRHTFAYYIVRILKKTGMLRMLRLIPSSLVTPMEFVAWLRDGDSSEFSDTW